MNKDMKKKIVGNRSRFLAAAVLTAALVAGQVPYAYAQNDAGTSSEASVFFPDNITLEYPVELSEVELPSNEFGSLSWADDSYIPESRVQSCSVKLTPFESVDLSWADGWDAEEGVVNGRINVIVCSIESEEAEYDEDEPCEETEYDKDGLYEETEYDEDLSYEETDSEDVYSEEKPAGDTDSSADDSADTAEEESFDENADNTTANVSELTTKGEKLSPAPDDADMTEEISETETSETEALGTEESETEGAEASDGTTGDDSDMEQTEGTQEVPSEGSADEQTEDKADGDQLQTDENISAEIDTDTLQEESADEEISENDSNIFDNPADFTQEDTRPTDAEDDLTAQEENERAQMNHSCDGIYVSGINLPWYVQFRVSSGEDYQFTNESDATIFRSYEFELWDLKNDTEYKIPDGEYISVTVPVKEGYDYTIEHLLDNGATETIIPSVEGDTMVFSTHSFSPFGIAGSKQLVGPDFGYDAVLSAAPTPTIAASLSTTPAAGGNNSNSSNDSIGTTNGNSSSSANNGTQSDGQSGTSGNQDALSGSSSSGSVGSQSASFDEPENTSVSDRIMNNGAVDTGDTTAILPFVILIGAAVVIIVVVIAVKKKKK